MKRYRGRVIQKDGRDVVVDLCSKSCATCPNEPSCRLLGPWREDLLGTRGLDAGAELILWHAPATQATRLVLLYGWYLLALLVLLGFTWFLVPSLWLFLLALIPTGYGAFRLQCRIFASRTARRWMQMSYRPVEKEEERGDRGP